MIVKRSTTTLLVAARRRLFLADRQAHASCLRQHPCEDRRPPQRCFSSSTSLDNSAMENIRACISDIEKATSDNEADRSGYFDDALNGQPGAISKALQYRDICRWMTIELRKRPIANCPNADQVKSFDRLLVKWLAAALSPDNCEVRAITFDTASGNTLEQVARGEAVHSVRSLSELKRRLHNGRRCYALFHRQLNSEPLAFIHVALTSEMATSVRHIGKSQTETQPSHAIFYSVNSPFSSTSGLDLASRLIKQTVVQILGQFPTVRTFSTLSPIPGFCPWLRRICEGDEIENTNLGGDAVPELASKLLNAMPKSYVNVLTNILDEDSDMTVSPFIGLQCLSKLLNRDTPQWTQDAALTATLQGLVTWIGGYYLVHVKQQRKSRGHVEASGGHQEISMQPLPLDNVARFHLRNGAELHRINWLGNDSAAGLRSSAGLMANYRYLDPQSVAQLRSNIDATANMEDKQDRIRAAGSEQDMRVAIENGESSPPCLSSLLTVLRESGDASAVCPSRRLHNTALVDSPCSADLHVALDEYLANRSAKLTCTGEVPVSDQVKNILQGD